MQSDWVVWGEVYEGTIYNGVGTRGLVAPGTRNSRAP